MASREDKELEEYRSLMTPPDKFDDGFNWKTVIGALFLGFIMMPGSMYLSLVIGGDGGIGQAARWVTIILFAEVARRSFKDLKMQEIYILFFMAGLAIGSPFQGLLWSQYFVQADFTQAMGIAQEVPTWVAPKAEDIRRVGPTFFNKIWLAPILMTVLGVIIGRIDSYGLGYVLYRLVNDVEELPFPMAPVGASGIIALANTRDEKEKWRWRCFSIGGAIGMVFGAVYIGIPVVTGAFLQKPVTLIPIPWLDLTPMLGKVEVFNYPLFAAFPFNLTMDLTMFVVGLVLPFWAVVGGSLGVLVTWIANPILYKQGILHTWKPGMGFVDTMYSNNVDFYLSFSVGLTVAVTVVSFGAILKPLLAFAFNKPGDTANKKGPLKHVFRDGWRRLVTNNKERGDFSIYLALAIYVMSSTTWILISVWLIPNFSWPFFVFYAVVYTPLISYATAKLEGLVGQAVSIPMVREVTYILSEYKGVAIWFAPAPIGNYGMEVVSFRTMELTGTRISSQIKTMLVTTPIIILASLMFSQLFWGMAEVPSDAYPYAQKMWELQLKTACLTMSATQEGGSEFMEAWSWMDFGLGFGTGTISYALLSVAGLPTLLIFGLVRGLGQTSPGGLVFETLGALIGRYYFRRKYGDMWMKYSPVILAGFTCGMGLIAMVGLAINILHRMMSPLVY